MCEYVALGDSCTITYQLNKYSLRKNSYPFDWTKNNLKKIINILENNFVDYDNSIEIIGISDKHKLLVDLNENYVCDDGDKVFVKNSIILKNKYGVNFAHEISNFDEFEQFKKKISLRMERFKKLYLCDRQIIFVYVEKKNIKKDWINNLLHLIEILETQYNIINYKIKLIINYDIETLLQTLKKDILEKIQIYIYNTFVEDWKMDILDWKMDILN